MLKPCLALIALLALAACAAPETALRDARIIAIGDSVMAWHGVQGASVVDVAAEATGLPARNLAVSGARVSHPDAGKRAEGYDIRAQFVPGAWDWVLFNGGANDLLNECGCSRCAANLDRLAGPGGEIPGLLGPIAAAGTRVMILGYYGGNVRPNFFSGCGRDIDILNARLEEFAARTRGVYFSDAREVIDPADQSHYFIDRVHPSKKGARLIGLHMAAAMRAAR